MAYTEADATAVRAAIVKLAAGERSTMVRYGEFSEQYAEVDLPKLRALLAEIEASVAAGLGTPRVRQVRMTTARGL